MKIECFLNYIDIFEELVVEHNWEDQGFIPIISYTWLDTRKEVNSTFNRNLINQVKLGIKQNIWKASRKKDL